MDHLAHHFIFGLLAFALDLARRHVALERLLHQLERHRNGPALTVIQRLIPLTVTAAVVRKCQQIKSLSSVQAFSWMVSSEISTPWPFSTSRTIALTCSYKSLDM